MGMMPVFERTSGISRIGRKRGMRAVRQYRPSHRDSATVATRMSVITMWASAETREMLSSSAIFVMFVNY
jgi:hypothetical protein